MMAEQPKPCPHCQGTDLKIIPRNWIDGDGFVLTCLTGDCGTRIWGHDEADVVARWNRRPAGPATKDMLAHAQWVVDNVAPGQSTYRRAAAFLAEWPEPATPPASEQPKPSPWKCCVCGEPVRIADDLMPRHIREDTGRTHAAELSDEDMQILVGWAEPATPPTPEQPTLSPWKCCICGEPVRIAGDLTVWHYAGATNHDAELSSDDRKTLADGLRLTD